jgi:hypothetical protein
MMTASHSVSIAGGHSHSIRREEQEQTAIWEEAYAWLALIPTLFITVGGSIHTESGPVAFRFTAMQEDCSVSAARF